ncbi:MAG: DUF1345 domain-containing protein [Leptothrix sp. (in: b-proteobacteria)]
MTQPMPPEAKKPLPPPPAGTTPEAASHPDQPHHHPDHPHQPHQPHRRPHQPHQPHRRPRWGRALRARPRLAVAALVGTLGFVLTPETLTQHLGSRLLVGWNAGALLYLALTGWMMRRSDSAHMRRRAVQQDDGRILMLLLVVVAAVTVLVAIGSQLSTARGLSGLARSRHLFVAALTVLTSWFFTQTTLAVQYAHDFYLARLRGRPDPLLFPGTTEPGYLDFMYFACVIGTSAQTADVSFNGSGLRGMGLMHCVLSFFFNTTVLALTINIAAGLF